jgi:hypothetical protein
MNISECVDFLNFWIRKERGAFYSIPELMAAIDRAQMAYFNDIVPKYATSQIVKDCLTPFREKYEFALDDESQISLPSDLIDVLDVQIFFDQAGRTIFYPVKLINEDELTDRLNSQIDPVSETAPVAEKSGKYTIDLYPQGNYTGVVRYLRRPVVPEYNYDIEDGRYIVFTSGVDLEWRDNDVNMILLKALSNLGINLTDAEVIQWSENKSQQNYQGVNHQ